MARIGAKDRDQIAALGAAMTADVTVDFFTQRQSPIIVPGVVPCESCQVTEAVLAELGTLLRRLKVRTRDIVGEAMLARSRGIDRVPALVIDGAPSPRVTFLGAPLGYEFSSFLSGILDAGGGQRMASDAALARLAGIKQPVVLKVFVTPT